MTSKLRTSYFRTLELLADHRILTITQLAAVLQKNKPAVRKRVRDLKKKGLVEVTVNEFGQSFGRPESLLGLTEHGADSLKENKFIAKDVPYENIGPVSPRLINHQLLLNWVRAHLQWVGTVIPSLEVRFLAHNSPFLAAECSSISIAPNHRKWLVLPCLMGARQ